MGGHSFHHFRAEQIAVVIVAIVLRHKHISERVAVAVAVVVESYYYFNNFPTLLRLSGGGSGASEGRRVIQKQFVEIKFDYVYCLASSCSGQKLSLSLTPLFRGKTL